MNQHTCHSWKIHDHCLASVLYTFVYLFLLTKEDVDGDIPLANNDLGKNSLNRAKTRSAYY